MRRGCRQAGGRSPPGRARSAPAPPPPAMPCAMNGAAPPPAPALYRQRPAPGVAPLRASASPGPQTSASLLSPSSRRYSCPSRLLHLLPLPPLGSSSPPPSTPSFLHSPIPSFPQSCILQIPIPISIPESLTLLSPTPPSSPPSILLHSSTPRLPFLIPQLFHPDFPSFHFLIPHPCPLIPPFLHPSISNPSFPIPHPHCFIPSIPQFLIPSSLCSLIPHSHPS